MARCGSSAIFEMIKDSCEGEKIAFFEPNEQDFFSKVLPFIDSGKRIVTKVLLRPYLSYEANAKKIFSKVVGLVRDPRDNIVSRLLFRLVSRKFIEDGNIYKQVLPLLEQKINQPTSVSVVELFTVLENSGLMEKMIDQRFQENLDLFMAWHDRNKNALIYKYENFVMRKFEDLSIFTEEKIFYEHSQKVVFPAIKRNGKFGEWKNWFTPEDVNFFRPRMEKFMERYGYPLDWNLPENQKINPTTSIDYIKRYAGIE